MLLLRRDHGARVLLEEHALALHQRQELTVGGDRGALVGVALVEDRAHRVLARLLEWRDAHRRVATETRQDLAGSLSVLEGLEGLGVEELDDRDPVRPGDHQRVVGEAHDAGHLQLDDALEGRDDGGIGVLGHGEARGGVAAAEEAMGSVRG